MRNFLVLFTACSVWTGCVSDGEDPGILPLQHVGIPLAASASGIGIGPTDVIVPPLGEGVAPILGYAGDGATVVTAVGGWSSGPGAVRWHGGQWLIPYVGRPGASLLNISCDVRPSATATDLVELVGAAGVIGSVTVPATTANVTIRAWIVLPPSPERTIGDGENLIIRHSPRDAATGAWTSSAQDMSIISCGVNALRTAQYMISPTLFISNNQEWQYSSSPHSMFTRSMTGSFLVGNVPAHRGDVLTSLRLPISGLGTIVATVKLLGQGMTTTLLGNVSTSVTSTTTWVPLVVDLKNTKVPDGTGLDVLLTGTASDTWGVDVGMIALDYVPAQ
jgi:hypothetical protein